MLPKIYQLLGSYSPIIVKPRLEPTIVPKTSRAMIWHGYDTAGIRPYPDTMLDFYYAPKPQTSGNGQGAAAAAIPGTRVFVGQAPIKGVYTGVKHG